MFNSNTDPMVKSLGSFFVNSKVVNGIVGAASLVTTVLDGDLQNLIEQYTIMNYNVNSGYSLFFKGQQAFLWGLGNKTYDLLSPEKAFIPGNYAKSDITTNPTPIKDITTNKLNFFIDQKLPVKIKYGDETSSKAVLDPFIENDKNEDGSPKLLYIYFKYKDRNDVWTLIKVKASIGDNK